MDIPIGRKRKRRGNTPLRRPGWQDHIEPHSERAIFWHALWKSSRSPHDGHVADIRRRTRERYRYAVRYVKRHEEQCRANKLAEALAKDRGRDIWNEGQKISGRKTNRVAMVDGMVDDRDIGELFARKTSEVFNAVAYDVDRMDSMLVSLESDIRSRCARSQCYHNHSVSLAEVFKAVKCLKAGKKDGTIDFSSDYIDNGPDSLSIHFSLLFSLILKHGRFPRDFALSTVIPLPKNKKKSLKCSSNYRGIALGSVIAKLFDVTILHSNSQLLRCSDLQYGFRKNHSTTQCTFVLNETIQYYLNGRSNVHVMLLDASKAFDRVEFVKLFEVLRAKGLCPLVCRILVNMYIVQKFRIRWNTCQSSWHRARNGVKQGGVISPVLFVNYIDELLIRLSRSGVGCYIGNVFCGSFGYADDITLLAPSIHALKTMLNVCSEYAHDFNLLFNTDKGKYIVFNEKRNHPSVNITGTVKL
ncbi:MAG: reverse transcriptase family protein [Kangiellaceae bacterium]|jgi:hypothetical protein|nr:reverse transcriptase family protein [Kangiellaceae bacterium]